MQQVYSNVSKVMVDSRSGSNLLYLPLDRLMQQAVRWHRPVPPPPRSTGPPGRDPAAPAPDAVRARRAHP
jgi:membrane protease subunit HflK